MYTKSTIAALSMLAFVGCGGSDSPNPTIETELNANGVPVLNEMTMSLKPLKKAVSTSFETHYKNGLYLSVLNDDGIRYFLEGSPAADASTSTSNTSAANFSTTITQEQGVDEADIVKYDGDYLYIANQGNSYYLLEDAQKNENPNAHVRILKRQADKSMSEVGSVDIGKVDTYPNISGMFLSDDSLTVLSSEYNYSYFAAASFDIWHPGPQKFNVSLFDVDTPESTEKIEELNVDGYVISSRRVDNKLVVVSSYSPVIEGLIYFPQNDEDKKKNFELIKNLDVSTLLPKYTDAAGVEQNLVSADDCFIPTDATNKDGYDSIVTLTTINLDNPSEINSVCINSSMQGIYATPESVYVYGSKDNKESVIHKFGLNNMAFDYQASTDFTGHVFGNGQSNLRFSEQGDYLRVVTTEWLENEEDRYQHKLKVFKTNTADKTLETVAELPNEANPAPIGKPNEDIYAVRYFGSKAYIVTFERIDPLYVIDLSDNTQPVVESALEIVGYSSYLHPISENLILGIGQNVDPNRFTNNEAESSTIADTKIKEGAKIALFDISGEPRVVNEFVFENSGTPAEYNYHALTYLKSSDDKHMFALPMDTWGSTYNDSLGYDEWYTNSELKLFEVNIDGAGGELSHVGSVVPKQDNNYYGSWDDRAIIHDDTIYYVHGKQVWQSLWSAPKTVIGPF